MNKKEFQELVGKESMTDLQKLGIMRQTVQKLQKLKKVYSQICDDMMPTVSDMMNICKYHIDFVIAYIQVIDLEFSSRIDGDVE